MLEAVLATSVWVVFPCALKRLDDQARRLQRLAAGPSVPALIALWAADALAEARAALDAALEAARRAGSPLGFVLNSAWRAHVAWRHHRHDARIGVFQTHAHERSHRRFVVDQQDSPHRWPSSRI